MQSAKEMKWHPLICDTLRSPGPYKKICGLPRTHELSGTELKETSVFQSDTVGFGGATSRTVSAPLKGVVQDRQ